MPFDATPLPAARPAPAARLCQRLGELQVQLQASLAPAARRTLEAEMAETVSALEMADAQAALLRQPHV